MPNSLKREAELKVSSALNKLLQHYNNAALDEENQGYIHYNEVVISLEEDLSSNKVELSCLNEIQTSSERAEFNIVYALEGKPSWIAFDLVVTRSEDLYREGKTTLTVSVTEYSETDEVKPFISQQIRI